MPESDVVDRAALNTLLAAMGGDESFLSELIDTYFADTPQLLTAMRQAIETGKAEELRRAAHSLKSNSANFGAMAMATMCKELEEMGKNGTMAGVPERLTNLEAEYEKVRTVLQTVRDAGL